MFAIQGLQMVPHHAPPVSSHGGSCPSDMGNSESEELESDSSSSILEWVKKKQE